MLGEQELALSNEWVLIGTVLAKAAVPASFAGHGAAQSFGSKRDVAPRDDIPVEGLASRQMTA